MKEASAIRESAIMEDTHIELILRRITLVCIAITAVIGGVAITGWVLNWLFLARISPSYILMAPGSALSFIILSFALLVYERRPQHHRAITFARVGTFLVLLVCFIILTHFFTGAGLDIENLLIKSPEEFEGFPSGRMSPITAANFLLAGSALLQLLVIPAGRQRAKVAVAYAATAVVSVGLFIAIGYLYEMPLQSSGTVVPVASTAFAFMTLGVALLAAAGPHYWPVSLFTGSSVQSRLVRVFLPVTIALFLISDRLDIVIYPLINNHILSESIVAILSFIFIPIVISKIAQVIGGDIDRANAERKQAEEERIKADERVRLTLDNMLEGCMIIGFNWTYLYVNDMAALHSHQDREKLIGRTMLEMYPGVEKSSVFAAYRRCMEERVSQRFESEFTFADGTINWYEFSVEPVSEGIFVLSMDITGRKRAEEERLSNFKFFECMDEANRAIQGANDLEQMMKDVLDVVLSKFDCDRTWLFYPCDPDAPSFRVPMEITKPEYPGAKILNVDLPMPSDMAQNLREALESAEPVTYTAGTEKPINKMSAGQFGVKSQMMFALYPKSGKPWVFGLHQCSYPRVWTSEEARLFQEIGRRLEDGLTGLLAHRDLAESETKYRRIVETANEGIWMLGENLKTTFVNARMAEMIGYQSGEMIGRPVTAFMFDEDAPDHYIRMENRRQGLAEHYERRYRHKNGQTVWTLASAVPILDAGQNFKGTFAMFTDITGRKRVEEALQKNEKDLKEAQRLGRLGSWEWDATTDTITWSEEYYRIYGFDPAQPPPGYEEHKKAYTPESAARLDAAVKRNMQTGEPYELDLELARSEGPSRWITARSETKRDAQGQIIGLRGTAQEITERKKAEETRHENMRLEAADKAKSEFLANMSHELRTPLNSSIGFSELLKEGIAGELNENQKHYVDNILTSNQFLLTLINDILDLSKIDAGKIELVIEKMYVPAAIKETLNLIKEKAMRHNVLLKTDFDPELGYIGADRQRIKQILFNLLSNAVKFSKGDGGTVTITAKKEGDMALISISDTGIGIKEENIGKLFHKFEQLESGISAKYGGTGLGLAITKQLVEMHGGRIWAESRYGEGSTFTFLLPIEVKKKEET